ncbi:hypothetical protein ACRBU7_03960 [Priestia aryabhattai]|uniref:hypothetical protein n=1 Tax=Priestia aryabhattai TaxID=412384 RepID=UPI003D7F8FE9
MNTKETLINALVRNVDHELSSLSYLTSLLDEDNIKYTFLPSNSKIKILIEEDFVRGLTFQIETTEDGYKLSPTYIDWSFGYSKTDLKSINRVCAETIIDNIYRITYNIDAVMDKHMEEKEAWRQKRKLLHKKEYLNNLQNEYAVYEYQVH